MDTDADRAAHCQRVAAMAFVRVQWYRDQCDPDAAIMSQVDARNWSAEARYRRDGERS